MTGRPVDVVAARDRANRRWLAAGVAAAVLVALGIAIGSRIASPRAKVATPTTVTVTSSTPTSPAPTSAAAPTRAKAVAAAATYVSELDGPVLLDPKHLDAVVGKIASPQARQSLVAAYDQASNEARARLGLGTVPPPVVILRAAPVGYRVDSYSAHSATISIWRVGVIGSGATVDPQQSWATETFTLVWESGAWKVAGLASSPGPTPPLPSSVAPSSRGDLFRSVPGFQEFASAAP
jgi:hypothetical protein